MYKGDIQTDKVISILIWLLFILQVHIYVCTLGCSVGEEDPSNNVEKQLIMRKNDLKI